MMSWDIVTVIICCILCLVYLYLRNGHNYWKKRGVPSPEPNIIFGNYALMLFRGENLVDVMSNMYKQNSHHRFFGIFSFQRPILMVNDPQLIKSILTKDFEYFPNRGLNLLSESEPLTQHLFNMENEKWKTLRKRLTPAFSSGKIKSMFFFMKECGDNLKSKIDSACSLEEDVESKDIMARYTTDAISSCAFGIVTNSLKNPDAEFRKMGARIFKPRFDIFLRMILIDISKTLVSLIRLRFFEKPVTEFFMKAVADVVSYREKNGVTRGDFLDLLIAMKNEDTLRKNRENFNTAESNTQNIEMTLTMITAQCFLFFAAGFETSSSTASFCLLELAKNPDVQIKVQAEVDKVIDQYDGELTYEAVNDMNYLNMVVLETLRLYPPLYILTRKCYKDYTIPGTNIIIEKDIEIIIPAFGLHRDEKYYNDPETFNPKNFTEEMKTTRQPFTYIPFGEGPRICSGLRFGMVQVKIAIAAILRYYNVQLSEKTELPIKFLATSFVTSSKNGIWLKFSKRTN